MQTSKIYQKVGFWTLFGASFIPKRSFSSDLYKNTKGVPDRERPYCFQPKSARLLLLAEQEKQKD